MDYTTIYDPDQDFDRHYTHATGARIATWLAPGERVLELGCATGGMTVDLVGDDRTVVAVDRSEPYLERARGRGLAGATFVAAELEAGALPAGEHDHVVLANVLHELDDPAALLRRVVDEHLAPGGLIHVSLQNPRSLHRLVALEMGLIDDLTAVAATGRRYATRRLYDDAALAALAAAGGLAIAHREGVMLKPLPNDAMAALDPAVLAGFVAAGRHLPEHCAMNLLVLRRA